MEAQLPQRHFGPMDPWQERESRPTETARTAGRCGLCRTRGRDLCWAYREYRADRVSGTVGRESRKRYHSGREGIKALQPRPHPPWPTTINRVNPPMSECSLERCLDTALPHIHTYCLVNVLAAPAGLAKPRAARQKEHHLLLGLLNCIVQSGARTYIRYFTDIMQDTQEDYGRDWPAASP
jgi:hypothetical protein